MDDIEYSDFLQYLFDEHIAERISHIRRDFLHLEYSYHFSDELRNLTEAMHTIIYIRRFCHTDEDVYATFTLGRLRNTIEQIENGVHWDNRLIKESGFAFAIENHFEHIVDGIKTEHFPEEELEILRDLGSLNPKVELSGIIYLLKADKLKLSQKIKKNGISNQLEEIEKKLSAVEKSLKEIKNEKNENEERNKPEILSWIKPLAQIGKGAALTLADVGLAIGVLQLPVSLETKTWGALVSTTTGIGTILSGVGDLPIFD